MALGFPLYEDIKIQSGNLLNHPAIDGLVFRRGGGGGNRYLDECDWFIIQHGGIS